MEYNITYRKKDKGWQYIISYKINNRWKQKARQGFTKKSDANKAAADHVIELKAKLSNDNIFNSSYDTITFRQVSDKFIEHSRLYKEYNSIDKIKNAVIKFKDIQNKKVKDIKKLHIQSCIDKCIKDNMSSSTIRTYLCQIKLILAYYKDNYDCNYVLPTEKLVLPKKSVKEKTALTKGELDDLLCKLKTINSDLYIVSLIAGTCGLRIGEIEGLTWADVNNLELNVDKQWKRLKDGSVGFGSIKNNKKRTVPLPQFTLRELREYHKVHPTDLTNRIIIANKFTLANKIDITLKKLAGVTIHELRHTYATLLISNGVDFKTAARILGHNVEQTLKVYSHVTDDMMNNAKDKIAQIF